MEPPGRSMRLNDLSVAVPRRALHLNSDPAIRSSQTRRGTGNPSTSRVYRPACHLARVLIRFFRSLVDKFGPPNYSLGPFPFRVASMLALSGLRAAFRQHPLLASGYYAWSPAPSVLLLTPQTCAQVEQLSYRFRECLHQGTGRNQLEHSLPSVRAEEQNRTEVASGLQSPYSQHRLYAFASSRFTLLTQVPCHPGSLYGVLEQP